MNSRVADAVIDRAAGYCECGCSTEFEAEGSRRATIDHFFGRAKAAETVETCWVLTAEHHVSKTANSPLAVVWLARFAKHCAKFGYPLGRVLDDIEWRATKRVGDNL